MTITVDQVSKRFQQYWIFKNISFRFAAPGAYALLGLNGSGKSTLLRILAGMQAPSKGKVRFASKDGKDIEATDVFSSISFCAPGMELVEELTFRELLDFHFSFKRPVAGLNTETIIELCKLKDSANKPIADYSSGMKQRVKLAQAIFSDTPVLMLDEPCTNLDQQGVDQYRAWMEQYAKDRLVIVASNDEREFFFCKERIEIEKYK
jgi:ABC-type multidrug transport system ATPase subunit